MMKVSVLCFDDDGRFMAYGNGVIGDRSCCGDGYLFMSKSYEKLVGISE